MKKLVILFAMASSLGALAQLNPDFSPNHDVAVCGPADVFFVCTSPANPGNVSWDFGDGTTGTGVNPVHYYGTTGTYDVKMVVEKNGVKDSILKMNYVAIRPNPESAFILEDMQVHPLLVRKFKFTGFSNADSIVKYEWKVGDSVCIGTEIFSYKFPKNSSYTISLTVTNNHLCSDQFMDTIVVLDDPDAPDSTTGVDEYSLLKEQLFTMGTDVSGEKLIIARTAFTKEAAAIFLTGIDGKMIASGELAAGVAQHVISTAGLPEGVYIVQYVSQGYKAYKRFSKIML